VPILGSVDAQRRGPKNINSSLVELQCQVVGNLASHREDDSNRVLLFIYIQHGFKAQLIEIKLVALVIVGAHCLWVMIDDYSVVA